MERTKLKICFVDPIGLSYNYSTLATGTVGGSEAAILNLVETFSQLNHSITVFNDCDLEGTVYGVTWIHRDKLGKVPTEHFDIVIGSRCLSPFDPTNKHYVKGTVSILWMHDYDVSGFDDEKEGFSLLTDYLNRGLISYIFTLSDWQTHYTLEHLAQKSTEGLSLGFSLFKNHILQTRNGMKQWPRRNTLNKDHNKFVYFSNIGRGIHQLLDKWHLVQLSIPDAQLHISGGSYTGDSQKTSWINKYRTQHTDNESIHFIPGMPQKELFEELATAYLTIYPNTHAETFCISALDSNYNFTPLVTSRHGALEQTAIPQANVLVNGMGRDPGYFDNFIPALTRLYYDQDFYNKKVEGCKIIMNDYISWKAVAIEWLAIFSNLVDLPISEDITYKARNSINWVNITFNCRNTTLESLGRKRKCL